MRKTFIQILGAGKKEAIDKAIENVTARAKDALTEYLGVHKNRIREDYQKNWRFKDLDPDVTRYLRDRDGSDSAKPEFDDKIDQLVDEKCKLARTSLSNVLGISEDDLPAA
jgi:hypothetical protein